MFDQLSSSLVPHVRVEGDIHVPQSCPLIPTCQLWRVYALIHIHTIIKFNSKTMKFHCVSLVTTNRIEHSFYWWISSPENFLCPLLTLIKQVFFRFICVCVLPACMPTCVHGAPQRSEGGRYTGASYRWLWAAAVAPEPVWEKEALNHWAIS